MEVFNYEQPEVVAVNMGRVRLGKVDELVEILIQSCFKQALEKDKADRDRVRRATQGMRSKLKAFFEERAPYPEELRSVWHQIGRVEARKICEKIRELTCIENRRCLEILENAKAECERLDRSEQKVLDKTFDEIIAMPP